MREMHRREQPRRVAAIERRDKTGRALLSQRRPQPRRLYMGLVDHCLMYFLRPLPTFRAQRHCRPYRPRHLRHPICRYRGWGAGWPLRQRRAAATRRVSVRSRHPRTEIAGLIYQFLAVIINRASLGHSICRLVPACPPSRGFELLNGKVVVGARKPVPFSPSTCRSISSDVEVRRRASLIGSPSRGSSGPRARGFASAARCGGPTTARTRRAGERERAIASSVQAAGTGGRYGGRTRSIVG